mgnify:CR=1 FL=1
MIFSNPRDLALDLLPRSACAVQVAAVIADHCGDIFAWGWNSSGPDGLGLHAEIAAIRRANRGRLKGATIYVASQRRRNGKTINSRPCDQCDRVIKKWGLEIRFRNAVGLWT